MPPVTRSKRRSARLSGLSPPNASPLRSKRIRTNSRTTPRKRVRRSPPEPPVQHPSTSHRPSPSRQRANCNTKLLDLPDEAISLIFVHLGATNTGGTFAAPRNAFSLAQTNTRLMSMFFAQLTRITPFIVNPHAPTLHPTHMFTIILRTRLSLRELCLPKTCHRIMQFLHIMCPRLERLCMQDIDEASGFPRTLLRLPLRSLTIRCPNKRTLRLLPPSMPEELSLRKLSEKHIPDNLAPIFQNPPKRLYLEIRSLRPDKLRKLAAHLQDACPKMEELTVCLSEERNGYDGVFIPLAKSYLSLPRRNQESKCRKLVVKGGLWDLVRHAHPEAVIEVSRGFQTFVNDGNKIYAKSIRLFRAYLSQDLSNVKEITVEDGYDPRWVDILTDRHFPKAKVTSIKTMSYLSPNVDVVDITIKTFVRASCSNWGWLNGLTQIRITGSTDMSPNSYKLNFIESACNVLDRFRGNLVWIRGFFRLRLNKKNSVLKRKVNYLARALDAFEASGGDAGTVRAIVQAIEWR